MIGICWRCAFCVSNSFDINTNTALLQQAHKYFA